MRSIKRTLTFTVAFGQRINALGEFEDIVETLDNEHDAKDCQKRLRKKYNDDTICINHVEVDTGTYVLSGEDFMRYAVQVDEQ